MKRWLAAAALLVVAAVCTALGVWQVERRAWKLRLIATVDSRVHAAPVAAPGPAAWPRFVAERAAYRRVRVTGRFDAGRATLVQAVTERGPGHWLVVPLHTPTGWTVLVNRGFLPTDGGRPRWPEGVVTIIGLLRPTEPGGGFLRANDAVADRWYSRDVAAIARARGLTGVAPYFIDAEATPAASGYPIGGMTVIAFRNAHLVYAITWFALAALGLYGGARVWGHR